MLQVAMKNAHAKGVVLIAASAARAEIAAALSAADPHVIAVTAIDERPRSQRRPRSAF
jgi:hypothetical protein